jgi:pyrroline-5-carboxylate reductase
MKKIAIIGMGTIGTAISHRLKKDFQVIGFKKKTGLKKINETEIVIIAVKPQDFAKLALNLKEYLDGQVIISVMAGISIREISMSLGTSSVIRVMPNLALNYGKSLTAVYPKNKLNKYTKIIVSLWGDTVYLLNENQFNSFTALCGSSPAYLLKMASQIELSAIAYGYDKKTSNRIVKSALDTAGLIMHQGNRSVAESISSIKSKGGITEEAFYVLDENNFDEILKNAIKAAVNKSKELSK